MTSFPAWIIPALVTLVALGWAWTEARRSREAIRSPMPGQLRTIALVAYLVAIVASLVAWLVWALVA